MGNRQPQDHPQETTTAGGDDSPEADNEMNDSDPELADVLLVQPAVSCDSSAPGLPVDALDGTTLTDFDYPVSLESQQGKVGILNDSNAMDLGYHEDDEESPTVHLDTSTSLVYGVESMEPPGQC